MLKIGDSKIHLYLSIAFVILGFVLIPLSESSNTTKIIWGSIGLLNVIKILMYLIKQREVNK